MKADRRRLSGGDCCQTFEAPNIEALEFACLPGDGMKLKLSFAAALFGLCFGNSGLRAEEGLWTFDNFPAEKVRQAYGFAPDAAWLDHVRLASVRLPGCSAGIVSRHGLVLTNHHCVVDCIQDLSAPGQDLNMTPVLAATAADERQCPGLEAEIVVAITDVTPELVKATGGLSGEAFQKARDAEIARITGQCGAGDEHGYCEVVSLYSGGKYALHKYRTYDDVRLVLGPEEAAGSFGGDPDNFNFPRYAFDIALIRLYENGKPLDTPDRLAWRSTPLADGELLFISGNPGETGRLWAASTADFLLDTYFPFMLVTGAELRGRLIMFAARGPNEARMASSLLSDVENGYKSDWGERAALATPAFADALRAAERDLRARVAADAVLAAEIGDPWTEIAAIDKEQRRLFYPYRFLEFEAGGYSELFDAARTLVRSAEERAKPEGERLPGYSNADLEQTAEQLAKQTPIEPAIEEIALAFWLSKAREFLTTDDPQVKLLLGRESPEGLAHRLVSGTRLGDAAERRRLYEGGSAAIARSDDPLIVFARQFDAQARALGKAYRETVREPKDAALERIARARFRLYGETVYPDATDTLRLNYGAVQGWTEPNGRKVAPFTFFGGLFERATGADPFKLAPLWEAAQGKLDPGTIFDIATSNDTIGGNSGSPVIDRDGKFVGALFDGNLYGFGGFYRFDPALNRSVVIAATAIEEGLAKVYGLQRIVDELKEP